MLKDRLLNDFKLFIPIIDLRPECLFLVKRLKDSYNVPFSELSSKLFLLPDKDLNISVVVSTPISSDVSEDYLTNIEEYRNYLAERGWKNVINVYLDDSTLWNISDTLKLLEIGGDIQQLRRRWLFQPAELLQQEVERIETERYQMNLVSKSMLPNISIKESLLTASSPNLSRQASIPLVLDVLDIGCGSGRDCAWLLSRDSKIACKPFFNPIGPKQDELFASLLWRVTALDAWPGALERLHAVACHACVPTDQLRLVHAQAEFNSGMFVPVTREESGDAAKSSEIGSDDVVTNEERLSNANKLEKKRSLKTIKLEKKNQKAPRTHNSGAAAAVVTATVEDEPTTMRPPSSVTLPISVSPSVSTFLSIPPPIHPNVTTKPPHKAIQSIRRIAASNPSANYPLFTSTSDLQFLNSESNIFDLILCVRILERALSPRIRALLRPGGFVLYCTFLDLEGTRKFGRPTGERHLLQRHELSQLHFGPSQGFEVVRDDVSTLPDGREVSMFLARKL
mmetsp:Transcript_30213/g.55200  ORF Transcript_30213/g.55200 Transcript_30213/m.55200 type:complete len:510 (-) Transcript_30213:79-1608(-)